MGGGDRLEVALDERHPPAGERRHGVLDVDRGDLWHLATDVEIVWEGPELAAYAVAPEWFGLGDRDTATHLVRSQMLAAGYPLSAVTEALCDRWQPGVRLLPMTDDRVETHVVVDGLMTHFANAMRPLHHRDAGPVGWGLLTDGVTVDVIADLQHLSPQMLALVKRCKGPDGYLLVSDAAPCAGLLKLGEGGDRDGAREADDGERRDHLRARALRGGSWGR